MSCGMIHINKRGVNEGDNSLVIRCGLGTGTKLTDSIVLTLIIRPGIFFIKKS